MARTPPDFFKNWTKKSINFTAVGPFSEKDERETETQSESRTTLRKGNADKVDRIRELVKGSFRHVFFEEGDSSGLERHSYQDLSLVKVDGKLTRFPHKIRMTEKGEP